MANCQSGINLVLSGISWLKQQFVGPPCFDEASTVRQRLAGTQPWLKLEINAMFPRTTSGKRLKFRFLLEQFHFENILSAKT
ncbi:hypothetical protein H9L39_00316 [Fusarium oxysporum f. sp. albedinis]|nr:hypothetical protein H9L39_00316 [Fusarium oxysporum f. sp. albedinis]